MKRASKPAYSAGAIIRTRLFTEGLKLLQLMAQRPVSRHDAGLDLKIHPRRWYRWPVRKLELSIIGWPVKC